MRILKNIYNEYLVYKDKLGKIELDQNKLFATIIYKNLYPDDFSELQNNNGKIYEALHEKKRSLIQSHKADIEKNILEIEKEIKEIQEENLQSVEDLRNLYFAEFLKNIPAHRIQAIYYNNSKISFNDIIKDEKLFYAFKNEDSLKYYTHSSSPSRMGNVDQIRKSISKNFNYDERLRILEKKENNRIEKLKKEKNKLQVEFNKLQSKSLQELLEDHSNEDVLGKEFSENDFLVLLLRNGYIDEDYETYISFFYEGSLKLSDKNFLQKVKSQINLSFDYELINIDEVLKNLRSRELRQSEVLNYDLMNYLLKNKSSYQNELNLVLGQLSNGKERSIQFIDSYIDKKFAHLESFINLLCKHWLELWKFIDIESEYTKNKKEKYLDVILKYSVLDHIIELNKASGDSFKTFISTKEDFIEIYDKSEYVDKIKEVLKKLSIKFQNLNISNNQSKLFQFIYKNDLYEINEDMISTIIEVENGSQKLLGKLNEANYSTVKESKCDELTNYIEDNISAYTDDVLLSKNTISEDENYFIDLLNKEELTISQKKLLIEKQVSRITKISNVPSDHWKFLFSKSKIKSSWENIVEFYSKFESISKPLIDFLNEKENYEQLSKNSVNEVDFSPRTIRQTITNIIRKHDISNESFKWLFKSINHSYDDLEFEHLSEKKVGYLVQEDIFNLTVSNYSSLKNKFSPLHIKLLEKKADKFLNRIKEFDIQENDLKLILESSKFNDSDKLKILQTFKITELKLSKDLADLIIETLLVNQVTNIQFGDARALIRSGDSISKHVKLINFQFKYYNNNQIRELISLLSDPYCRMVKSRKKPKIKNTEYNVELVKKLQNKQLISTHDVKKNYIKVNAKEWK